MSEWILYLIIIAHNLDCILGVLLGLFFAGIVILTIFGIIGYILCEEYEITEFITKAQRLKKILVHPLTVGFVVLAFLSSVLVPSYKEIAAIYIIPKVINAQMTQKIPETVNLFLNKYIEEMSSEKH